MPSPEGLPEPDYAAGRARLGNRKSVYIEDHESFGAFIMSDQMRDPVFEVTKDIEKLAGATAKRDNSSKSNIHHYADGFKSLREGGALHVHRALRVMCLVYNDDPVALYNEFGNRKSKRLRTLGRAGAKYGDFKPDGGLTS